MRTLVFCFVLGLSSIAATELFAEDGEPEPLWSLAPLSLPSPFDVRGMDRVESPIDRFVIARLEERGLSLAAPADRRTLIRRVSFDLIGLPPAPEEVAAFVSDPRADDVVLAELVDRLLASPRYGEREARRFLDLVHFAETHGHDEDAIRPNAWPYRDWVVRALNEDMPFSRFVAMQVAGDVLFPDDPWGPVATGLLAAGPWDASSQMGILDGTTDKEIARILDRDDMVSTVMSTFASLTVHCARCHDHKFDPIPQEDYWALQAVFAGVDRVDRPWDPDPAVRTNRERLTRELGAIEDDAAFAKKWDDPAFRDRAAKLERELIGESTFFEVVTPSKVESAGGSSATVLDDGSVLFGGACPPTDTYKLTVRTTRKTVTGLRLDVLPDPSLPASGPGRALNGNLHLSEVRIEASLETSLADRSSERTNAGPSSTTALADTPRAPAPVPIESALSSFDQDAWTIQHAIDGDEATAWGIHPREGSAHTALFRFASPVVRESGAGAIVLTVELAQLHGREHLIGKLRLSVTDDPEPKVDRALPAEIGAILAKEPPVRDDAEARSLARFLHRRKIEEELAALPPPSLVYAVASEFDAQGNFKPALGPRPVHVLRRGDVHSPIAPAEPGALSALEGLASRFELDDPGDEGSRRVALARWLVDHRNVLTWRSIVNRVWQSHFGQGIVSTPNDFGRNGARPSQPELLDWLAVTFRDGGGSLKSLHRAIVLSATYRQAWRHDPEALEIDPSNRLLWRAPLRRLDAECIRDAMLEIAGELDLSMYGPSVRHFSSRPGVHVTPVVDYGGVPPESEAFRRRSIWRFVFRTQPDPWFQALDCPDPSQLTPKRTESTSVLQALALLHHPLEISLAEKLAARLEKAATDDLEAQVKLLFELAIGRAPEAEEVALVAEYASLHGLANACRFVFNLDEFLYVD